MADNTFVGLCDSGLGTFDAAGDQTTDDDGQPRRKYRKDLIRVGNFFKQATGQRLNVNADRLAHWRDTLKGMRSAGIDIDMPATTHDGASIGQVIDAEIEGDRLVATVEMRGVDGIRAASRNHVSPLIDPSFTDDTGKTWPDAITHVAVVGNPVITKQRPFVPLPIAASRASGVRLLSPLTLGANHVDTVFSATPVEFPLFLRSDDDVQPIPAASAPDVDGVPVALQRQKDLKTGAVRLVGRRPTDGAEFLATLHGDRVQLHDHIGVPNKPLPYRGLWKDEPDPDLQVRLSRAAGDVVTIAMQGDDVDPDLDARRAAARASVGIVDPPAAGDADDDDDGITRTKHYQNLARVIGPDAARRQCERLAKSVPGARA